MEKGPLDFAVEYQDWYTKAIRIVNVLAPDRFSEFARYYESDPKRKSVTADQYRIQDYVYGFAPTRGEYDPRKIAEAYFGNQSFILMSLFSRIDGVIANLETAIAHGIQDAEMDSAESLKKVNLRAAGSLAGVVLETHLQRVAAAHSVPISKKDPTIGDLNEPLKKASVYDTPVYRKIQLMADIRNICTHQKGKEPTPDQIDEMLNGVRSITKSVF